jgi:hypothetical protein
MNSATKTIRIKQHDVMSGQHMEKTGMTRVQPRKEEDSKEWLDLI